MGKNKQQAKASPSFDIVGRWVVLPAEFWGPQVGKDTWGAHYTEHFDVVQLEGWFPATKRRNGDVERWSFKADDGETYFIPIRNYDDDQDITTYFNDGRIKGFAI